MPVDREQELAATAGELGAEMSERFPFVAGARPVMDDPIEQLKAKTWAPTMEVIGIDGVPSVNDGGILYKVTFANGSPATPEKLATGLNFPTSVTICDANTQICPEPTSQATPATQATPGHGGR